MEDELAYQELMIDSMPHFQVICLSSINDVKKFIDKHPAVDIIALDGVVLDGTTPQLVKPLKAKYHCPIIGMSDSTEVRINQIYAGVDYSANKADVPWVIKKLLSA